VARKISFKEMSNIFKKIYSAYFGAYLDTQLKYPDKGRRIYTLNFNLAQLALKKGV